MYRLSNGDQEFYAENIEGLARLCVSTDGSEGGCCSLTHVSDNGDVRELTTSEVDDLANLIERDQ